MNTIEEKINILSERISVLEKENESLKTSSDFPLELRQALDGVGYLKTGKVLYINATDYSYLSQTLASAEIILGIPTGFIQIVGGAGDNLLIPVYLQPRTF